MGLNCFRPSTSRGDVHDVEPAPRRPRLKASGKTRTFRRQSSDASKVSRSSTYSNESISKLPPCHRVADPTIDLLMMPEAAVKEKSKCLRLSLPRTYADIIEGMKCQKGCRDWKNFAVFYNDDVDDSKTAEEYAREKRASYEKRWAELNSFSDSETSVHADSM